MGKQGKQRIRSITMSVLILLVLALLLPGILIQTSTRKWILPPSQITEQRTIIVLGAGVYKNRKMSAILTDRMDTAIDIYRMIGREKILLSGDHGTPYYDEVNAMKRYALEKGVHPEDIFLDHAGFNTYDSLYRAFHFYGIRKAVIVSQNFHLPRALYVGKNLGMDVRGVVADRSSYDRQAMLRWKFREFAAGLKAFYFVHVIRPNPKGKGGLFPISGDGRKSWPND
jgi:vancomycin permeability regulator SanA